MNTEKEYWGMLSAAAFQTKLTELTAKFGEPRRKRRLSFAFNDWNHPDIDVRLKITNGKPELVLKLGDWNSHERQELEMELKQDVDTIYNHLTMLTHLIQSDDQLIIQYENYEWENTQVEIKLSHQFGKTDKYTFEVEQESPTVDLDHVCQEIGLTPDHEPKDRKFWDQWNAELNLDLKQLTEPETKRLISSYL